MLKNTHLAIALFTVLLINCSIATSQTMLGQFCITAGPGFSVIFPYLNGQAVSNNNNRNSAYGTNTTMTYSTTPAYNAIIDYGYQVHFGDNACFSIGACIGYQSTTFNYSNYVVYGLTNTVNGVENFQEKLSRLNIGIRSLWHFTHTDEEDAYCGVRVGYTQWTDINNSGDPNFSSPLLSDVPGYYLPSFQALLGYRYYFINNLGFNVEIALGTPYLIEAGITYKIGGSINKPDDKDKREMPDVPIQVIH